MIPTLNGVELLHSRDQHHDPIVRELDGGLMVVGYLAHDDDCADPLTDSNSMGHVWTFKRGYRVDHDEIEAAIKKDLAVRLDVYDHGGMVYAISGSIRAQNFPDQQWDVAHGGAVWVPDQACEDHIEVTALQRCYADAFTVEYHATPKKQHDIRWIVRRQDGPDLQRGGYKTFMAAARGACRALALPAMPEKLAVKRTELAHECCQQALDEYNRWLAGDCWGVCCEAFDLNSVRFLDDACWGFIGDEYAQSALNTEIAVMAEQAPAAWQAWQNRQEDAVQLRFREIS